MQFDRMKRREFIALLGGVAAAWPLAARAQQGERMRRVGLLLPSAANNPAFQLWVAAFIQAMGDIGWIIGKTVEIDIRWATNDVAKIKKEAADLVALAPDVILAHGASTIGPL